MVPMAVLWFVITALDFIYHSIKILAKTPPIAFRFVARLVVAYNVGGFFNPVPECVFLATPH